MFIVDAHLDLAYAALNYGRNLTQPLSAIRAAEPKKPGARGTATVSLPDIRQAGVRLAFGTLFVSPGNTPFSEPEDTMTYTTADEAHTLAMRQLDYYHQLADTDPAIQLVGTQADLNWVIACHATENPRLGIVPLMEGADPIRHPEEVAMWHERGLRLVGLAWDDTRYAAGAWRGGGGLTKDGCHLLEAMADLGMILDLTHMSEQATLEAIDRYEGPIVATHANARRLVPGERQLSDTQIRRLGERDGVIGVVFYNRFLRANHQRGEPKERVTLAHVAAHIDHICQVLGDAAHVGIGSDFDGGFGAEDIPAELDSAADLPALVPVLREMGYSDADIRGIMGENWVRLLRRALPEG